MAEDQSFPEHPYKVGDQKQHSWGSCTIVKVGPLSCTQQIVLKPLQALSLQSHLQRSERWWVKEGILAAIIGEDLVFAHGEEGKWLEVPIAVLHAAINPSKTQTLTLQIVQSGRCLDSDVVRYRDPAGQPCVSPAEDHLPTLKSLCLYDAILVCLK